MEEKQELENNLHKENFFGKPIPDLFLGDGLLLFVWILAADRNLDQSLQQGALVIAAPHQPWNASAWSHLKSYRIKILQSWEIRVSAITGNYVKWDIALFFPLASLPIARGTSAIALEYV